VQARLRAAGLAEIDEKLQSSERLTLEDGVRLFDTPDLLAVGYLANREREKRHGARTYFNYNLRLEPTNVCEATCLFCSFSRLQEGMPEAYTMSLEQAWDKLRQRANQPLTEVHVVNGLNPHLPFSYYTELLRGFKRIRPSIHLKCFTAVEIAYFSQLYGMSDEQVLRELKDAGLGSMPGGGAEVFADRVRKLIAPGKEHPDNWIATHRAAHGMGIPTHCTMLYGHVETYEERVDHLLRLRDLQDETGGFLAFIPLPFHPENTVFERRGWRFSTGYDDLRMIAVSRLMLDNIANVKAYWIMISTPLAQVALHFGANDIQGTVMEEQIAHAAGAVTPQEEKVQSLVSLIREAGRVPVQRDTLYNAVRTFA